MAAADNPYFISPANPLQALMTGVQGYETADKRRKENELDAAFKALGPQIQQGGLDNNALATLFGAGPAAAPMITAAGHFATNQEAARHNRATEGQAGAQLDEMRRQHDVTDLQPVKIGSDPIRGDTYGIRDPKSPFGYRVIDPNQFNAASPPPSAAPGPASVQPPPMQQRSDVRVGAPLVTDKNQEQVPALPAGAPMGSPEPGSEIPGTARPSQSGQNSAVLDKIMKEYGPVYGPRVIETVKGLTDYRISPTTLSTKGGHREALIGMASEYDPTYDQTTFPNIQQTRNEYAKGKGANTVRSLNVAIDHLNTYEELAGALKNGNVQVINSIKNKFQTQFGATAPANLDAAKQIIGAEIVKAIVGAGGGVGERQDAANAISAAKTPEQFDGVIQTYKKLLAGQLEGHRRQYETGARRTDFDKFLSPDVQNLVKHLREDTGSKTEGTTTGGIKWKVIQ